MNNRLPRTTPEAQGISSERLLQFIESAGQQIQELHSFMLVRHGSVVSEGWWSPYAPEHPHMLFSLSKSFTSSAIGLAVAEGRLSVEDKVLSFFPDDAPAQVSVNLVAMRVRDLLSMSTGHAADTVTQPDRDTATSWVQLFLSAPVAYVPGTHFVYNSGATYMLSAIIQKLTGMTLLDYLQPRLMQPLGIENATWERSPQGINTGGWGLKIKTEDIACFGQMYLQKGLWQGKQILSEAWVEQATKLQIENGAEAQVDWRQGYGYQFWRCRHGAYRGDGAFGQFCVVMPEQDAVLAITSGVGDMQAVLNLVWERLLPALGTAPLHPDSAAQTALAQKQSSLALLPPQGHTSSPVAAVVSGHTYRAEANPFNIETVSMDFADAQAVVTLKTAEGEQRLVCGCEAWQEGARSPLDVIESPIVASGVWTADDIFSITLRLYETPFYRTLICHFSEDRLFIEVTRNLSFRPEERSQVVQFVPAGS